MQVLNFPTPFRASECLIFSPSVLCTATFFTFFSRLFLSEIACEYDRDLSFGAVKLHNGVCCQPKRLLRIHIGFDNSDKYPDAIAIIRYLKKPFCHKEIFIFRRFCFSARNETLASQHLTVRKFCFYCSSLNTFLLNINHVTNRISQRVSERNPSVEIIYLANHKENLKTLRQASRKP